MDPIKEYLELLPHPDINIIYIPNELIESTKKKFWSISKIKLWNPTGKLIHIIKFKIKEITGEKI